MRRMLWFWDTVDDFASDVESGVDDAYTDATDVY